MTSEDIRSEMERQPFAPFRIHLVGGKTLDVTEATLVWMLQNAVLLTEPPTGMDDEGPYNILSLRNIERLERIYNAR
jgi:hypothetical protein